MAEIFDALLYWTPYLAGGFAMNLLVTAAAIAFGSALGIPLAYGRLGGRPRLRGLCQAVTAMARNIPTFVFLFYIAFLIPVEFEAFGRVYAVPGWLKASLGLSVAVVGYLSDTLVLALQDWRNGDKAAAMMHIPGAGNYLLVMVIASSTASTIGVSEIVSRANVIIAAVGGDYIMLATYLYAMLWFFAFCFPLTLAVRYVARHMSSQLDITTTTAD